jgi:hypothetical protein
MAELDDADSLNLEQRARELAEEAKQLRKADPEPVVEPDSKRTANEELDRRLAAPLERLRKFAK